MSSRPAQMQSPSAEIQSPPNENFLATVLGTGTNPGRHKTLNSPHAKFSSKLSGFEPKMQLNTLL